MRRRTQLSAFLAVLALGAALTACNGDSDDDATPGESTSSSDAPSGGETSPASTADPSETEPTDDEPSGEPTETTNPDPSGSDRARAKRAQIAAADLPGFNDGWTWERESGGEGGTDSLPSVCMLTGLESIGGVAAYHSVFGSSLDESSTAVVMTAVFPDQQTATLSATVLQSWHAQCAQRAIDELNLKQVKVGDLRKISTSVGPARDWLTSYKPVPRHPDDAWFEAQGFVIDGDTLSYIVIKTAGQDYNYEAGQAPIDRALVVAADRLKSSR